jgi:endonuclease III
MKRQDLSEAFKLLRDFRKERSPASVTEVAETRKRDPFLVLVSCIISLRTKDEVTSEASRRLFAVADTPERLRRLSTARIEKAIYPCGFYRNKAQTLREISGQILERFDGEVPDTLEDLLTFKGVGRKTANLVLTLGHGKPGICVDIHVHRITNRWGLVQTKTPDRTEFALRDILPKRYWIPINHLLVIYGQNVCRPVSPRCSQCKLANLCDKVGVTTSR